jgi:radical SAM superfamily enzyme YgiQ (UPF0313 family)
MKVLLVQPNYNIARKTGVWLVNPPLGLAYLASVLQQNDIFVEILDANALNLTPNQVLKQVKGFDIVGVSLLTPAHNFGVSLAKILPDDVLKIAGGPHATGNPNDLLNAGFDIIVRGEGEHTFLEIAQEKSLKNILGISYKKGNKITHNQPRPPLDPNELPLPARDLLPSNGVDLPYLSAATMYRPWSPVFTSRGCMFNCYYCNKKTFGYNFRALTPENVIKEIEFLVEKYKVKEIDFYDDSWNQDLKRAETILDMIIEKGWDIHLRSSNGIRVDKITKSFIQKFKKAGGDWVSLGIESGNQKVLDNIPKNITLDQVRKSVKIIKDTGIIITGFFMLGLIGDTEKTMQDTINFAKELDVDIAQFTIATPYPGTRMYEMVKQNGELLANDWDTFHHTLGKMLYRYPGTAEPEIVEKMYKKAHKEYYLRPQYMFRQLLRIKTKQHLKFMLRGLKTVLKIQRGYSE